MNVPRDQRELHAAISDAEGIHRQPSRMPQVPWYPSPAPGRFGQTQRGYRYLGESGCP